nr:classical arabinogalactan protein 9-like [Aegilops tauschii subsp. strangulata]
MSSLVPNAAPTTPSPRRSSPFTDAIVIVPFVVDPTPTSVPTVAVRRSRRPRPPPQGPPLSLAAPGLYSPVRTPTSSFPSRSSPHADRLATPRDLPCASAPAAPVAMPVCAGSRALPSEPAATALPLLSTAALHAPAAPSPYAAPCLSPRLRRCRRRPPLLAPLASACPPLWPRPATTRTRTAPAVDAHRSAFPHREPASSRASLAARAPAPARTPSCGPTAPRARRCSCRRRPPRPPGRARPRLS